MEKEVPSIEHQGWQDRINQGYHSLWCKESSVKQDLMSVIDK